LLVGLCMIKYRKSYVDRITALLGKAEATKIGVTQHHIDWVIEFDTMKFKARSTVSRGVFEMTLDLDWMLANEEKALIWLNLMVNASTP